MKLEAIITCVGFADYLDQTLGFSTSQFDKVVVVTSHGDLATPSVCRRWGVDCVRTDAFTEGGEVFAKGHAINQGLMHLRQDGWLVHMDADIAVPLTLRRSLQSSGLSKDSIYGAERFDVMGWGAWQRIKAAQLEVPQVSDSTFVLAPTQDVGAVVVHKEFGYCPIGYFQLWWGGYTRERGIKYADVQGDASRDDMVFALSWPREKRLMLPMVRLLHLRAGDGPMGTDWKGRASPPFGRQYY